MKLLPSHSLISGLPIRDLLKKMIISNPDPEHIIAMSMFDGASSDLAQQVRRNNHLTHSTEIDHQIRFPLKSRVERMIGKLAVKCAQDFILQGHSSIEVSVFDSDYLSVTFLHQLEKAGVEVRRLPQQDAHDFAQQQFLLSENELRILSELSFLENDLSNVYTFARERVYSGDYRTAEALLLLIPKDRRSDSGHHLLGLCANFFERTNESELHFQRLLQSPDLLSQIKATYVLSMLYLRLHPREKQCLETAERFLSEGHFLIESNPQIDSYYFHSVFNRNGYALCLFRRGKILEALEMLDRGIEKLRFSQDGAKNLHQSVLIYNAVQCLRALYRFSECEKRCKDLIHLDPLFPEYWLELGVTYLQQGKLEQALSVVGKAQQLDAHIPEIYALKGYVFLEYGQIDTAAKNYAQAVQLAPENSQFKSDLEYCLQQNPITTEAAV